MTHVALFTGDLGLDPGATVTDSTLSDAKTQERRLRWDAQGRRVLVRRGAKALLFAVSLLLFVLAINLMKEGALSLSSLVQHNLAVSNPLDSLGFGWLFAYVIMSGSPVAAVALTLFTAGILDDLSTFSMVTGSRLGASFVVLLIGFIYVLRGRDRATSLGMGLLSLIVTGSTHFMGLFVGVALLVSGVLDPVQLDSGLVVKSAVDAIFDPLMGAMEGLVPRLGVFLIGLGVMIISFNLFDRSLPQMTLKESQLGKVSRFVYRPFVMLILGAGVTLISMSVSVSLSILVPLSSRGFVRRENVVPYIMGANITTFIDTLLAAVLLGSPAAFTIVLAEMVSVALVSLGILVFVFRPYEVATLEAIEWITDNNRNLALFLGAIFIVPIVLVLL
jgi:solute carrier family 34 (sodium-dependent phosphate cotransporter)